MKKGEPLWTRPVWSCSAPLTGGVRESERYDVLCLRAFLALRNRELDLLTLSESLEARSRNSAEVRKYIGAGFLFDEAESFRFVEPLDGSCNGRHI